MGKKRLAVACFLWGNWPEMGWGEEYVYRLHRGVQRHLSIDHDFICFADKPERLKRAEFEVRKLAPASWVGCLPKLYAYAPQSALANRRVLVLDLDNIITGSLDDIASYRGPMCVRAWFRGWDKGLRDPALNPEIVDGDMISFEQNEVTNRLYGELASDPQKAEQQTGGRERFYLRTRIKPDLWQAVVPGQIVSWKNHMRNGIVPENARIVSCHGKPRPHELNQSWIKEHWK